MSPLPRPNREIDDHLANARTPWLLLMRGIPLLGDELAMPTKDCVRRKQRADFKESLAAEDLAFHGQASSLVVGQENSLLSELLS